MIDVPQIIEIASQLTAVIRITVPREQIREVMGPAMHEVLSTVASQGLQPIGPMFSHHFRMDPAVFDFEVGVPVASSVKPEGRVVPSSLPATRVARTIYHGGYEGLGNAWGEFESWIAGQSLNTATDLWECYTSGPESSPNPADWKTELNRPLLPSS